MHRLSPRRARLALAAPFLAVSIFSSSTAQADEYQLVETIVATPALRDPEGTAESQRSESAWGDSQHSQNGVIGSFSDAVSQPDTKSGKPVVATVASPATASPATASPATASPATAMACQSKFGQCECCRAVCCTRERKQAATRAMKSAYAGVFYANDFAYLDDPCYTGPNFCGDALKNRKTALGTISLGGETRFRYHNERNFRGANGLTGNDDNFWLYRQRLYTDWQLTDNVRIYGELLDANASGETLQPLIIEENDLDIQNLFVDLKLFDASDRSLIMRIGRQELLYGAQRTISPLDWANTRRKFEGVRGLYQNGNFSVDAFWTRPVDVRAKAADRSDEKEDFFGAYATLNNVGSGSLEAYYLGYNSDNTSANPVLNRNFTYHTLGTRTAGKIDDRLLYDLEGAYQFGDNNTTESHSAGFVSLGIGRKFEGHAFKPTVWGWYDYSTGEEDFDEVSIGDGGYHHLFPLAHKYVGFLDLFGRRNLHDLNTQIITPLSDKVTFLVWYHYFMLAEDTLPYNVVMIPYAQAGGPADDRELGHEIDLLFNINLNPRNNIVLGYSHFSGGDYYDAANIGPGDEDNDADFFYAQFQTRY